MSCERLLHARVQEPPRRPLEQNLFDPQLSLYIFVSIVNCSLPYPDLAQPCDGYYQLQHFDREQGQADPLRLAVMHRFGIHSGAGFCPRRQCRGATILSAITSTNKYHNFADLREQSLPITLVPAVTARLSIRGMEQDRLTAVLNCMLQCPLLLWAVQEFVVIENLRMKKRQYYCGKCRNLKIFNYIRQYETDSVL